MDFDDVNFETGFVAVPRGLISWEWYDEPNTCRLFIHLLLTSNWKETHWHGITIPAGGRVTSRNKLAEETHMSVRSVRTAIERLKTTKYITVTTTSKYSVIAINNYEKLTGLDKLPTSKRPANDPQATHERPANDPQATTAIPLYQENNDTRIQGYNTLSQTLSQPPQAKSGPERGAREFLPPSEPDVIAYFTDNGGTAQDAAAFVDHYTANGWMMGSSRMRDWKAAARGWIRRKANEQPKASNKKRTPADWDRLEQEIMEGNYK